MRPQSTPARTCLDCGKALKSQRSIRCKPCAGRKRQAERRANPAPLKPIAVRFWQRVDTSGDCWIWTGNHTSRGYGLLPIGRKVVRAHRVSWELHFGPIPKGLHVLHRCDVRACVNPAHLWLGTHMANMDDRNTKHRQATGERHGFAKLTESSVRDMRAAHVAGGVTVAALARRFDVSYGTAHHVITGRTWRHVF